MSTNLSHLNIKVDCLLKKVRAIEVANGVITACTGTDIPTPTPPTPGGNPTLQQVTSQGNTTTNSIIVGNSNDSVRIDNNGVVFNSASKELRLKVTNPTSDNDLTLPNTTGTLVATINNTAPDAQGNVTLSISGGGGGSQSLQSVTAIGASSTNSITLAGNSTSLLFKDNSNVTGTTIDYANVNTKSLSLSPDNNQNIVSLKSLNISGVKTLQMPNANGTLVTRVNSKTASTAGDVTLTLADILNGAIIPTSSLPDNFFSGFTGTGASSSPYTLVTDAAPTASSVNPVQSGGVYSAIQAALSSSGGTVVNNYTTDVQYSSISTLRAMASPTTSKLYFVNDTSKEGFWYYDPSDTDSVDNTGTILVSGTKRFKRIIPNNKLNLLWFNIAQNSTADQVVEIQKAFTASVNSELYIPAGTYYTGRLYLASNTKITGEGTLKAHSTQPIGGHVIQIGDSPTAGGKTNIIISGINIDVNKANTVGSAASGICAIKVWASSKVTITNVSIKDNNYLGVVFSNSSDCLVDGCFIDNTDAGIITFGGNKRITIVNNIINSGTSEPISLYGAVSGGVNTFDEYVVCSNNTVTNKVLSAGINMRNLRHSVVSNNTVKNCVKGISTESLAGTYIEYVTITGNNIDGAISSGIDGSFRHCTITSNVITDTGGCGIWVGSYTDLAYNNIISNNIVKNSSSTVIDQDSIRISHGQNNKVIGNSCFDDRATKLVRSHYYADGSDSTGNEFISNYGDSGVTLTDFYNNAALNTYYNDNSGTMALGSGTAVCKYGNRYYSGTGYNRTIPAGTTTITLPMRGDYYEFTAVAAETLATITAPDVYIGRELTIRFMNSNITVNGSTGNIKIASALVSTSKTVLTLVWNGTSWMEKARIILT